MEEYDRFQEAQNASTFKQDEWIKQSKNMEINTESLLSETQSEYENKLRIKSIEIARVSRYF